MPCYQAGNVPAGYVPIGSGSYATEAECLQACKEGACCNGTTCSVKPQCQCNAAAGEVFKGVGTVCSPNPCGVCGCDPDSGAIINASSITVSCSSAVLLQSPSDGSLANGGACADDSGMVSFFESISLSLSRTTGSSGKAPAIWNGSGTFGSPFGPVLINASASLGCQGALFFSFSWCPTENQQCLSIPSTSLAPSAQLTVPACSSSSSAAFVIFQQAAGGTQRPDGCMATQSSPLRTYQLFFAAFTANPLP